MSPDDVKARLAREAAKVECPICRHRQWLSAPVGRCDQCGSEIILFDVREDAERSLEGFIREGRVAYLRELAGGLYAVIANRAFPRRAGS
jgi:DNA-directed RNA polymerase subunit RPC12/RpoP